MSEKEIRIYSVNVGNEAEEAFKNNELCFTPGLLEAWEFLSLKTKNRRRAQFGDEDNIIEQHAFGAPLGHSGGNVQ